MGGGGYTLNRVFLKLFSAFFLWVFISTISPCILKSYFPGLLITSLPDNDGYLHSSSLYQLNAETVISNDLVNSDIVLVTAHPDDESMFFSPTIMELNKKNYGNQIHLVCLSNGNFDGLGEVRRHEVDKASQYLDISSVVVLRFEDNISKEWDPVEISQRLNGELPKMHFSSKRLIFLTFDEDGVSGHPNHQSLFYGVKRFVDSKDRVFMRMDIRFFKLSTWPIYKKYSGFFWVNFELLRKTIRELGVFDKIRFLCNEFFANVSPLKSATVTKAPVMIYNNFNTWIVSLSTMTYAHYSQIVWFRWFWIFLSKYMNSNELVEVLP
ncbi:hypothetical protein FOA43_000031 [Brettanomyces nanus]|uniref:N-acetylglucosaminylphosphatidylinositol deacetylase n=1 Tax=Eeniella nana TaxID=13502 RepID=A0A875RMU8_EENNA|nr:uncharacterized protein FOA43_000031 [Brettanomyces nanus]QPG72730.1 hypothetical protein FOA43_000031 [Brettanomyces nanus]